MAAIAITGFKFLICSFHISDMLLSDILARVAELVDALASGASGSNAVLVRFQSRAQKKPLTFVRGFFISDWQMSDFRLSEFRLSETLTVLCLTSHV